MSHFSVYDVRYGSKFIVYLWMANYSSTICWKVRFWRWTCLWTSVANHLGIYMGLFPGSRFCSLIYVSIPLPIPLCLDCSHSEEIRSSKFSVCSEERTQAQSQRDWIWPWLCPCLWLKWSSQSNAEGQRDGKFSARTARSTAFWLPLHVCQVLMADPGDCCQAPSYHP